MGFRAAGDLDGVLDLATMARSLIARHVGGLAVFLSFGGNGVKSFALDEFASCYNCVSVGKKTMMFSKCLICTPPDRTGKVFGRFALRQY